MHDKSFGPILCPKCGKSGILIAQVYREPKNWGPYFYVQHTLEGSMRKVAETISERVIHCSKPALSQCYLGKLSLDKLDEIVKRRPWPINAREVNEALRKLKGR